MPGKVQTKKIIHVTTMVKDTARAMKFYNDLIGIKQIQSQVDNPAITWLQLESGIMVHLIETPDAPAKPSNIHHAFEVEDFEGTKEVLKENGFNIDREGVRYDGQCYLFINDPDGNSVEFCTASGYAPAPPGPPHKREMPLAMAGPPRTNYPQRWFDKPVLSRSRRAHHERKGIFLTVRPEPVEGWPILVRRF